MASEQLQPGVLVKVKDGHLWAGLTVEVEWHRGIVVSVLHDDQRSYVGAEQLEKLF